MYSIRTIKTVDGDKIIYKEENGGNEEKGGTEEKGGNEEKKELDKNVSIIFHGMARQANELRRIILESIPMYAVKDVTIRLNNSVYSDEYIKNRISLCSITTDVSNLILEQLYKIQCKIKKKRVHSQDLNLGVIKFCEDVIITEHVKEDDFILDIIINKNIGKYHARYSGKNGLISYKEVKKDEEYHLNFNVPEQYSTPVFIDTLCTMYNIKSK